MNLLGLKGAITNLTPALSTFSAKKSKASVAFVLAGLITATNWIIQTELTQTENDRANELIKRVNEKKTVNSIKSK
jgi:hypothetical protein